MGEEEEEMGMSSKFSSLYIASCLYVWYTRIGVIIEPGGNIVWVREKDRGR